MRIRKPTLYPLSYGGIDRQAAVLGSVGNVKA
jgi:hypothetical protein